MLFNSVEFLFFLPIVFCCYWFVFNKTQKMQNAFICIASYTFYGWWDWRFLLLIAFTSFCSWYSGVLIEKQQDNNKAKGILWSNIIVNFLILGFFKYYNFFIQSFIDAFALCGITLQSASLKLILPVGISFYTFQALSYSIDIYKKKLPATSDLIAFFAYVSFFPQLVAGPIERATNLLPQIQRKRKFDYSFAVDGCRQMLWGFFKKVVIADNCAIYANMAFSDYQNQSAITLLFGALMFTFQIYGDFSGYSDIAIGTSKLFGIQLKANFIYPYFSRNVGEFWKRWHISLNTWFVDYIYIPLGGSRVSQLKVIRNTFIIFLVSGLWHGANWTFVVWGMYHALLFMPMILLKRKRKRTFVIAEGKYLPSFKEFLQVATTFSLVVVGWIIFRSESVSHAYKYISGICDSSILQIPSDPLLLMKLLLFCTALIILEWIQRDKPHVLDVHIRSQFARFLVYLIFFVVILAASGNPVTFIYFQF